MIHALDWLNQCGGGYVPRIDWLNQRMAVTYRYPRVVVLQILGAHDQRFSFVVRKELRRRCRVAHGALHKVLGLR